MDIQKDLSKEAPAAPPLHVAAPVAMPPEPQPQTIDVLVLDDSQFDAMQILRECRMTELPVRVYVASSVDEFQVLLSQRRYHLVFIDYLLPDGDGLSARRMMKGGGKNDKAPVVMISGEARHDVAVRAMKDGCIDYLAKEDLTRDALKALILRALAEGSRMAHANIEAALETQRQEIVAAMREILREELGRGTAQPSQEGMRRMLQSYGLAPEGDDRDFSDLLNDPATNFIFRTH